MKKANYLFLILIVFINSDIIISGGKPFDKNFKEKVEKTEKEEKKLPIVFHRDYVSGLAFVNKILNKVGAGHPFDLEKYQKINDELLRDLPEIFNRRISFYEPESVSDQELEKVHSKKYLESLQNSLVIAQIAEVYQIAILPSFLSQRLVLKSMRRATGGTILGAQLALQEGWAINLGGGFHHAKTDSGEGFCFYNDIALTIKIIREKENNQNLRVLYIDVDAHQGNGVSEILSKDKNVVIFDMYNCNVYPNDTEAAKRIDYPVKLSGGSKFQRRCINDEEYMFFLEKHLNELFKKESNNTFDLIIYNAGTDIYKKDPLGQLNVSDDGIIKRDEFVWNTAEKHNIPILMLMSGGYTQDNAEIISRSIKNLLKKRIEIAL